MVVGERAPSDVKKTNGKQEDNKVNWALRQIVRISMDQLCAWLFSLLCPLPLCESQAEKKNLVQLNRHCGSEGWDHHGCTGKEKKPE